MRKKLAVMMAAMAATAMGAVVQRMQHRPAQRPNRLRLLLLRRQKQLRKKPKRLMPMRQNTWQSFSMYRSKKIRTVLLFPLT